MKTNPNLMIENVKVCLNSKFEIYTFHNNFFRVEDDYYINSSDIVQDIKYDVGQIISLVSDSPLVVGVTTDDIYLVPEIIFMDYEHSAR